MPTAAELTSADCAVRRPEDCEVVESEVAEVEERFAFGVVGERAHDDEEHGAQHDHRQDGELQQDGDPSPGSDPPVRWRRRRLYGWQRGRQGTVLWSGVLMRTIASLIRSSGSTWAAPGRAVMRARSPMPRTRLACPVAIASTSGPSSMVTR